MSARSNDLVLSRIHEDVARELERIETRAAELGRAIEQHGPMRSAHEGYAVLLEELDELKAEVWKGGAEPRDLSAMRKEAIEVAAMAIRFVHDVCEQPDDLKDLKRRLVGPGRNSP